MIKKKEEKENGEIHKKADLRSNQALVEAVEDFRRE